MENGAKCRNPEKEAKFYIILIKGRIDFALVALAAADAAFRGFFGVATFFVNPKFKVKPSHGKAFFLNSQLS